jgi:transcriptional regulator GlxA family with amidase domain
MAESTAFEQSTPLNVGMLLYPNFTLLDLAGPHAALGMHGKTHLLWKTMDPVWTDTGISINPTTTFEEAPADLDVVFVPGGHGTGDAMQDQEILEFLARAGSSARYVTSVCTGSLLLGKAGLLDGYRAATHWRWRHRRDRFRAYSAGGAERRSDGQIHSTGHGVRSPTSLPGRSSPNRRPPGREGSPHGDCGDEPAVRGIGEGGDSTVA